MRSFSITHILLVIILVLAYQCILAQDYIITTQGDSIIGKIKVINYGPDKKVNVTDNTKKKTGVPILQTKVFVLNGEKFHPVRNEKGYSYMKVVKEGYLSLYAFQIENQTSYNGSYLYKRDGKGMEVPNLGFKKMMTKFLLDCPDVGVQISNGTLGKKELNQIIDNFNECVASKSIQPQKVTAQKPSAKEGNAWSALEEKIKSYPDFAEKSNALDMIREIKSKIQHNESVPNFLTQGLKSALSQTSLNEELEIAIRQLN